MRPRRHLNPALIGFLTAMAAVGCDEPADPSGGAVARTVTAEPEPASLIPEGSRETPPLSPELAEIFGLIGQYRTGPARVRLVKYQKLHPDDGQAAFLFGLTYHREKRYGKALPHYQRAVQHAPDYWPVHHFLGWAHLYLGEPEAARAAVERHLQAQPDVADSHFAIGLIELDQDRLDEAERRFRHALTLQESSGSARPRDVAKAHAQLGEVCARTGRLDEARRELERAVELFPDHYEAWYRLSRVLVQLGDEDAAGHALEQHKAAKERVRPGTSFPE